MAEKQLLFDAGHVVRTGAAFAAMLKAGLSEWNLLERHQSGDFGEVSTVQQGSNLRAIAGRGRVFSVYRIALKTAVWVITDLGQRSTTVLTPCEYAPAVRRTRTPRVSASPRQPMEKRWNCST